MRDLGAMSETLTSGKDLIDVLSGASDDLW